MAQHNQGSIVVAFNRDHEGTEGDPENLAREDVLSTASDVAGALREVGFQVDTMGVTDDVGDAIAQLAESPPDVVFNLCESFAGEGRFEAVFPLLLELNGFAFTGSTAPTLMLAVYKDRTKQILQAAGVRTPQAWRVDGPRLPHGFVMQSPLIVKPSREDASVGISSESVVTTHAALERQVEVIWERYRQPVLVEQYIEGREIYVAKLDDEEGRGCILPLFEVDFSALPLERPRVVTFEAKWMVDSMEYAATPTRPVQGLSPAAVEAIERLGHAAFEALEVRDYGRVDIRVAADGTPYVIDVNPNCDLSSCAGFTKAVGQGGTSYPSMVAQIAQLAVARKHADTISIAQRPRGARKASGGSARQSISRRRSGVRTGAARGSS